MFNTQVLKGDRKLHILSAGEKGLIVGVNLWQLTVGAHEPYLVNNSLRERGGKKICI